MHIHSLNLLNLVYIVVLDAERALENLKLVILGRLELQVFFAFSQNNGGQIKNLVINFISVF